jgi:enhancer of polycomb-like protein
MEMTDTKPPEQDATTGAEEFRLSFTVAPQYPTNYSAYDGMCSKGYDAPFCRIRQGRGGRLHLEMRKPRVRGAISRGVVSDSESDDDSVDYYPVSEGKAFDYRCALNSRTRPEGGRPSGDQTAMMAGAQAAAASQAQQAAAGSST